MSMTTIALLVGFAVLLAGFAVLVCLYRGVMLIRAGNISLSLVAVKVRR